MKTLVIAVALCAMMAAAPAANAVDWPPLTLPTLVAEDNNKGTVERCIKWVEKVIKETVNGKVQTRTVAVCAVRG